MTCRDAQLSNTVQEELIAFPILFERQQSATPGAVAIVFEDRQITYDKLAQMASHIAAQIQRANVQPGQTVGLCLDRSPEAIAAMLGVMQAGAVFVPLDPDYPIDRLTFMVEDANIGTIITSTEYRNRLETAWCNDSAFKNSSLAWIEGEFFDLNPLSDSPTEVAVAANDLAYIMYTSGSTGNPKGVQIEHQALAAYCFADIEIYKLQPNDRTLQFSTLNFDIAIEEIFPPLLTGGCIVVRPANRSANRNELSDLIQRFEITAIHLATAYWHEWVDLMVAAEERIPESIRLMVVTGEKVSVEHYRRWQRICDQNVLWCNAYGPTETTVTATVFIPNADFDADNMPIGKPLKRYTAHILDTDLKPVAQGETGELYIGGPALARGYLNRKDLTDESFVHWECQDAVESRLYKTGDLARWCADGNIDFAGRIDHQIKLGSYRIEPGEIEAAINQYKGVLESLVSYDQIDCKKALVAYIATGGNSVAANELAQYLRNRLPTYMIPARYVFVDSFQKTINGKVDRDALPHPSQSIVARDSGFVPPRTELERKLAEMWADVLSLPEVGIHDDFFALGGSSLLVTRIVSQLTTELQLELPVRDFFANPTIASAARHIQQLVSDEPYDTTDEDCHQMRTRLPKVHACYFPSDDCRLYSVRYEPQQDSLKHNVLICHPYGHEYTRAYRNLQQLAVLLCKNGFDVLRFDYSATGNSEGNCDQVTMQSHQQDIQSAANFLRQQTGHHGLSIVGCRLGATLAASANVSDVERAILWDPVLDGNDFLKLLDGLHKQAIEGQTRYAQVRTGTEPHQAFGHSMSDTKRQSIAKLRLPDSDDFAKECLILTSDRYAETQDRWLERTHHWLQFSTVDAIRWYQEMYTESAFSSPEAYSQILQFLVRGRH